MEAPVQPECVPDTPPHIARRIAEIHEEVDAVLARPPQPHDEELDEAQTRIRIAYNHGLHDGVTMPRGPVPVEG